MKRGLLYLFLMGFILCGIASVSYAQDITFSHSEWNFGEVIIGDTQMAMIQLISSNSYGVPLGIYSVALTGNSEGSIAPPPEISLISLWSYVPHYSDVPVEGIIPEYMLNEYLEVTIEYAPTAFAMHEAYLQVVCNDRETPVSRLRLYGSGIEQSNPVPEPMSATLFCLGGMGLFYIMKRK